MSTDMNELLLAFAKLPAPLPPAALDGLLRIVRDVPEHRLSSGSQLVPGSALRRSLIRRTDLPASEARALAGTPLRREYSVAYLSRPDVKLAEVVAALDELDEMDGPGEYQAELWTVDVSGGLARDSRDPQVLEHLTRRAIATPESAGNLLMALIGNRATPISCAAAAVECTVERIYNGTVALNQHSLSWLSYEHQVPLAVVEAWAPRSRRLAALAAVVTRSRISPGLLLHVAATAADLVPVGGSAQPDGDAYQTLKLAAESLTARGATREALVELIQERGLRCGRISLVQALGLVPAVTGPLPSHRAWRNSARKAVDDTREAQRLLDTLVATLGDNPASWSVLTRLGGEHTGTVAGLATAAAAVALDPAAPNLESSGH